jgi:hypothetical protein
MPSKTFQPLLYDTFEYKPSASTYYDAYKWKTNRLQFKKRVPASAKITTNASKTHSSHNVSFDLKKNKHYEN